MAEKQDKPAEKEKKKVEDRGERIIRILSRDVPGNKSVYAGLLRIKGVSWILSNALCTKLGFGKKKKVSELTPEEIKKIEEFIKNPDVPSFMKNRRKDRDTGEDKHLNTTDLDLQREFDIKRLKKIKSYKGSRHAAGQPVRGQRTKSHFRKNKSKGGGKRVAEKKKPVMK